MRAAAIELQAQQLQPARAPSLSSKGWGWGLSGEAEGEGGPLSPRGGGGGGDGGGGADAFLRLLEALLDFVRRADAPGGGDTARRRALLRELSALRLVMALLGASEANVRLVLEGVVSSLNPMICRTRGQLNESCNPWSTQILVGATPFKSRQRLRNKCKELL